MVTKRIFLQLVVAVMMISALCATEVKLEFAGVRSEQLSGKGRMVPTVLVHDTFMLKIIVSGTQHNPPVHRHQLPKEFTTHSYHNSTSIQIINGHMQSSTTHVFELEAQVEGTFKIGPLSVDDAKSNELELHVRARTDADERRNDDDEEADDRGAQRPEFHLRLVSSEQPEAKIYAGAPVVVSRLSLMRGSIRRSEAEPVTCAKAAIKKLPGDLSRVETINGKQYRVTEERYLIFPSVPGGLSIPAQRFVYDYVDESRRQMGNHPFGFLMEQLMAFQTQRAEGRTNALNMTVLPLPKFDEPIDAVGQFSSYSLKVDRAQATTNQPITVTVSLSGIGNFDEIAAPHLTLPREMLVYPSGGSVVQEIDVQLTPGVKEFSYVVQSQRAGTITIPAQKFTFFDTQSGTVRTLTTEPQVLEISPATGVSSQQPKLDEPQQRADATPRPVRVSVPVDRCMPWSIFFILMLLPLFFIWRVLYTALARMKSRFTKVNKADLMSSEMVAYFAQRDCAAVGRIMRRWIADRTGTSSAFVTESFIEEALANVGCLMSEIDLVKSVYFWTLGTNARGPVTEDLIIKVTTILRKL